MNVGRDRTHLNNFIPGRDHFTALPLFWYSARATRTPLNGAIAGEAGFCPQASRSRAGKPAKLDNVVADKVPRASGFKVLILRRAMLVRAHDKCGVHADCGCCRQIIIMGCDHDALRWLQRSEEHTSELQSLMRISYAVFCLKKKTHKET